ncbi:helix-turn-helix transcriptional regulator [Novosphingobium bradum]|uniref:Helix-turn-helix transcriptional regulator n=1 Tax=Novosphingobium bradum TaxID=1737444 RepID=A0ABV7ISZ0_9SPHN
MTLAPSDERDLLVPLHAGLLEQPPWQEFTRRLAARTGAERAGLLLRGPAEMTLDCWFRGTAFSPALPPVAPRLDPRFLGAVLRPLRVYTLDEVLDMLGGESRDRAGAQLSAAGIGFARAMQVPAGASAEALVVIEHATRDFTAADGALLSGLGPHIATALQLGRELDTLRRRAEMAEDALAALGVSQALLDAGGQVVVADRSRPGLPGAEPGTRLRLASRAGQPLADALAAVTSGTDRHAVLPGTGPASEAVLLRSAPASAAAMTLPHGIVALSRAPVDDDAALAHALIGLYGLSAKEGDLAVALSRGAALVPAGVALGLTPETARNYSKRIYAKTGARGQADLVRLILGGVAPFAAAPRPTAS